MAAACSSAPAELSDPAVLRPLALQQLMTCGFKAGADEKMIAGMVCMVLGLEFEPANTDLASLHTCVFLERTHTHPLDRRRALKPIYIWPQNLTALVGGLDHFCCFAAEWTVQ